MFVFIFLEIKNFERANGEYGQVSNYEVRGEGFQLCTLNHRLPPIEELAFYRTQADKGC